MKKLFTGILFFLLFQVAKSQTVAFTENFQVVDSVIPMDLINWSTDTAFQANNDLSYHGVYAQQGKTGFTTIRFSTTGNSIIFLDFDHIAKIEAADSAIIEVSKDSGATWTRLENIHYLGSSTIFGGTTNPRRFNSGSYTTWKPATGSARPDPTWWKHERFDISTVAANSPDVMIRFRLSDGNGNGLNQNYGWNVDDIVVTADISERVPPVITLQAPSYSGTLYRTGPFPVNVSVVDPSGVDDVMIVYSVNGGALDTVMMSNTTGNNYTGNIPVMNHLDTVCYYVFATDSSFSFNPARNPDSTCISFNISTGHTIPYVTNFESGTDWSGQTSANTSWQFGTPAFGVTTGAHSGVNAWDINLTNQYGANANVSLTTPGFNFSNVVNGRLAFWQNRKTQLVNDGVTLEYSSNDGATWNTLGTVNDPLGTNWFTATVSGKPAWDGVSNGWVRSEYILSAFDSVTTPIRFRFRFTSNSTTHDDGISIDDFSIVLPSPKDAAILGILTPDFNSCVNEGNHTVSALLKNYGLNNLDTTFTVWYQLDSLAPVQMTYSDTLAPGALDTISFPTLLNITAGTHELIVYSDYPNDGLSMNDTSAISFNVKPPVGVPYANNFESGVTDLDDFCVLKGYQGRIEVSAAAGNSSLFGLQMDAVGSAAWTTATPDTISTSPNFIWNESVNAGQLSSARLTVKTDTVSNLILKFDLKQLFKTANINTSFRLVVNGVQVGNTIIPSGATTPFTEMEYDLSPFLPAPVLYIDFESKVKSPQPDNGNFVDNIQLYEPVSKDATVLSVITPSGFTYAGDSVTVTAKIKNLGFDTITTTQISYSVNNGPLITETYTGSLAMNATANYTFNTKFVSPGLSYSVCVFTQLSGELNVFNDTSCNDVMGFVKDTLAYTDNFEGVVKWYGSGVNAWQLGMPSFNLTNTAHSGTNAWDVFLNGGYSPSMIASLYTQVFDIDGKNNVTLSFWQNRDLESTKDAVILEYSTNRGGTWNTLGALNDPDGTNWFSSTINGKPQWSGISGGWVQSTLLLDMLNGSSEVQFRFVFTSNSTVEKSGFSIDDFSLVPAPTTDAGIVSLIDPVASTCLVGQQQVSVQIRNYGNSPIDFSVTPFTLNGNVTGPNPFTFSPVVINTGTLAVNATQTVIVTTNYNMNAQGTYGFNFNIDASADGKSSNDSLINATKTVTINLNAVNYFENFDASFNLPQDWSGSFGIDMRGVFGTNALSGELWSVTPSFDAVTPFIGVVPANSELVFDYKIVDWGSNDATILSPGDKIDIYVSDNCGSTYTKIHTINNLNHISSSAFRNYAIPLTAYQGDIIKIKIEATWGNGDWYFDLDNFQVKEKLANDIAFGELVQPGTTDCFGPNKTVSVSYTNIGIDTVDFTVTPLTVTGNVSGANTVTFTPVVINTGSIAPGATNTVVLSTTLDMSANGVYTFNSAASFTGDQDPSNNNMLSTDITVSALAFMPIPQLLDFENFAGSVTATYPDWNEASGQVPQFGFSSWTDQTGVGSAFNTTLKVNIWGNGDYDWVMSNYFTPSSLTEFTLDIALTDYNNTAAGTFDMDDKIYILVTENCMLSWDTLDVFDASDNLQPNLMNVSYGLSQYTGKNIRVAILGTNGAQGLADVDFHIDNVSIKERIPFDISPVDFKVNSYGLVFPGSNNVSVKVLNRGEFDINSGIVSLYIDNTLLVKDTMIISPAIPKNSTYDHTFSVPWNATSGVHTIMIITERPNDTTDFVITNDTLIRDSRIFESVSSLPFCNNFETNANTFISLHSRTYSPSTLWEKGMPDKPKINTVKSGSNAWVTKLTGTYGARDSAALFSPMFNVSATDCYNLSFWHNYDTQKAHDGGTVEFSMDTGKTWIPVGYAFEMNWFNTPYIDVDGSNATPPFAGWSDRSNGWILASHDLKFYKEAGVIFRFNFLSDAGDHREGWAIDDVCIKLSTQCIVSVEEADPFTGGLVAYPNPSAYGDVTVEFFGHGKPATVEVYSITGQKVYTRLIHAVEGKNKITIDESVLSATGVYFIQLRSDDVIHHQKFIRNK